MSTRKENSLVTTEIYIPKKLCHYRDSNMSTLTRKKKNTDKNTKRDGEVELLKVDSFVEALKKDSKLLKLFIGCTT